MFTITQKLHEGDQRSLRVTQRLGRWKAKRLRTWPINTTSCNVEREFSLLTSRVIILSKMNKGEAYSWIIHAIVMYHYNWLCCVELTYDIFNYLLLCIGLVVGFLVVRSCYVSFTCKIFLVDGKHRMLVGCDYFLA